MEDRIEGLGAGADDYVAKPFSLEEVLIRLHRLVERSGAATADSAELVVGDLVLNMDSHDVSRAGREISLTATEFDFMKVSLGPSRLRTETAGVAACHVLNLIHL